MVFRRRNPRSLYLRLRHSVLPPRGWSRAGRYMAHRLGRLPEPPYRIAAGFACGAAVSFTPAIGLHFVLAAGLSLLLRANVLASAIGTIVGNPWTFPFIWAWTYAFGRWMLGSEASKDLPTGLTLSFIFEHPWEVLWPMIVGGLPTAGVVWIAAFVPLFLLVRQYQSRRQRRLRKLALKRKQSARRAAARREAADGPDKEALG